MGKYRKYIDLLNLDITNDCISQLEQMAIILEKKVIEYSTSLNNDYRLAFRSIFGAKYIHINQTKYEFTNSLQKNIELIISYILELAGYYKNDHRLDKITSQAVYVAIFHDSMLRTILDSLNIMFYQVGVIPNIKQEVLPSQDEKPNKKRVEGLRQIRKYQKTTDLLMNTDELSEPLQVLVEQIMVEKLKKAFEITISQGDYTVSSADFTLFTKIEKGVEVPYDLNDINLKLSNEDILKLGYRAGIPFISKKATKVIIEYISQMVSLITHHLNLLLEENIEEKTALPLVINAIYDINFIIP